MKNLFKITGLTMLSIVLGAACLMAAGVGPSDMAQLGMHIYKDKNLSLYENQSCQTCHHPLAGFADPTNLLDPEVNVVSVGSDGVSLGGRNAPTSAYAGYSPIRYQDEATGEWYGGMFWDGRATGETLGDPLAEQAQGPPLNPVEMALKNKRAVIDVIKDSAYYDLWIEVFGPITNVNDAYDNFGRAIAAFERSHQVTKFSSKFDTAPDQFTMEESVGQALFEANCTACHPTESGHGAPGALFTTYGYANIGLPANPPVHSEGPDLGLGGDLGDPEQDGKFKIPTLRNIALTAPYGHNGRFATLEEMVTFLAKGIEASPEVPENISPLIDDIALDINGPDIDQIVAFLRTLTDR